MVEIRPATVDDIDAMLSLRAAVAAERFFIGGELPLDLAGDRARREETVATHAAGGPAAVFVAVDDDGVLLGDLGITERVGIAEFGMNIAAGHRGRGIGTSLLDAAITWARTRGCHKVELERWSWNHAADALYEKFGFEVEGYRRRQYRRKDGSLWDSVVMGLVLDHDAPGHDEWASEPPR